MSDSAWLNNYDELNIYFRENWHCLILKYDKNNIFVKYN